MRVKLLALLVLGLLPNTISAPTVNRQRSLIEVTGHPDAVGLAAEAFRQGVPRLIAWAIAYQESRHNLDPTLRGYHCRGRPNCEVGRFQVRPSTARLICPDLDIMRYKDNIACGIRYLRLLYEARGSWPLAVRAYQCPKCTTRTSYELEVMATVGKYAVELGD